MWVATKVAALGDSKLAPAAKPEDLNLVSRTHMVEEDNQLVQIELVRFSSET